MLYEVKTRSVSEHIYLVEAESETQAETMAYNLGECWQTSVERFVAETTLHVTAVGVSKDEAEVTIRAMGFY